MAVTQGARAANGIYCTDSDVGRVLCTDGSIYDNVAAATAAGRTAVAKIIYLDQENNKGWALALQDEAKITWYGVRDACSNKNTSIPVAGATWKLASKDEWQSMISHGADNHNAFRVSFSGVGGTDMEYEEYYWLNTESYSEIADKIYSYIYKFAGNEYKLIWQYDTNIYRACLEFNLLSLYTIGSAAEWTQFCNAVNGGSDTFSDKYVKLTQDISVSAMMAGTSETNSFQGVFDGDGHTLTVSYNTSEDYSAPFRHVKDAVIKNLRVAGSISTSVMKAAGFVGESHGWLTITNSRSSVAITGSKNGDGTHGGFVATLSGENNAITFDGCVFDGSFNTTNGTTGCGGFVGWGVYNKPTIKNSLMKPSSVAAGMVNNTFARWYTGYEPTITGCYYAVVDNLPANQGTAVHTISAGEGVTINDLGAATTTYDVSGIKLFAKGMWCDTFYAANGDEVNLNLSFANKPHYHFTQYVASAGTLSSQTRLSATLVMPDADVTINGEWMEFTLTGEGTAEKPLLINSTDDWNTFATYVNGGYPFSGEHVQLTADISVTEKVGTVQGSTQQNPFSGTFDGGGKTITVTLTNDGNQGLALFSYINGATIKNLNVGGSVSGGQHAAALVGFSKGTGNVIEDCTVTASVSGGTHVGGLLGHGLTSDISITRCVFSGTISGGGTAKGTLFGWGDDGGTKSLTDCIYLMADGQNTDGLDLVKGSGTVTVERCYKTTDAGSQGSRAYVTSDSDICTGLVTINGTGVYTRLCPLSGVESYYRLGTGVSITPTVKDGDNTLSLGTHYTATLNGEDVTSLPINIDTPDHYTLILTGIGDCMGTKTIQLVVMGNDEPDQVTSETTTMSTGRYKVYLDVNISSRITISGDVTLYLGDGITLTAPKGIELSAGNSLTIEGPGALTINGCDDEKSGIGAANVGTLTINGGAINVRGGSKAAGIGGDMDNENGGSITINGGVVNATGGIYGAGIGGGMDSWKGRSTHCGDIVINGGQVTATGGMNAAGIGYGWDLYDDGAHDNGTLTLGWTTLDDFVYISSLNNSRGYTLNSITFDEVKEFVLDGTETVATASNMGGKKIVPNYRDGNYALDDGTAYTVEAPFMAAAATYTKTISEGRVGKYHSWLVPFDYTITAADAEKFTFYKLYMIANAIAPDATMTDGMWLYVRPMQQGDVLHANMPYLYVPLEAVTDYEFTTADAVLKAKATDARITMMTAEDTYTIYGTYGPTVATDSAPFYYMSTNGNLSLGNDGSITVGAFRWIMRVENKFGGSSSAAYARQIIIFDGEDSETTGISSLTPDPSPRGEGSIYTLDGRKLNAMPTQRGIYVVNGRKVVIK